MFRIVFLGDIVGRPGRDAVESLLPSIRSHHSPDLVIANGENASGGLGIDPRTADELFALGIDVMTLGNHVWQKKELHPYLESQRARIIRPINFPPGVPGHGWTVWQGKAGGPRVAIVNAIARVFMPQMVDCPFRAVDSLLEKHLADIPIRVFDFHGEATSEKLAFGFYLNGRASVVLGTHTHVQTADERILSEGTAYISDVGMCGPRDTVIGVRSDLVIERFLTSLPGRFDLGKGEPMVNGIVVDIDESDGKARAITRINQLA